MGSKRFVGQITKHLFVLPFHQDRFFFKNKSILQEKKINFNSPESAEFIHFCQPIKLTVPLFEN